MNFIAKSFWNIKFCPKVTDKLFSRRLLSELKPDNEDETNLTNLYDWSVAWLNKYTGKDLSKQEREEILKYLLPSGLFAKDARPHLNTSKKLVPKEAIYIKNGVPLYPGYYTLAPKFQEHLYRALFIYTSEIDQSYTRTDEKFSFDREKFLKDLKERVPTGEVTTFRNILCAIHHRRDSGKFEDFLQIYREIPPTVNQEEIIDQEKGETRCMGKRKTSIADVVLKRGTGKIIINDREFEKYFPHLFNRETVLAPFYEINDMNFDVCANVIGGGFTGQAGAIRMAIALCLKEFNPLYAKALDDVQYTKLDLRFVERKKCGRHKARKRYTWVAR